MCECLSGNQEKPHNERVMSVVPDKQRGSKDNCSSFWEIQFLLVAQLVKNPSAMWETLVRYLGWKDPLEKEWLSTPGFWPGEFQSVRSQRLRDFDFLFNLYLDC